MYGNKTNNIPVVSYSETKRQSSEFVRNDNEVSEIKPDKIKNLEVIRDNAGKTIQYGLNKKNASTGTPIDKLSGAAKFTSQLSNIGGGMEKVLKTIIDFVDSNSRLQTMQEGRNTQIAEDWKFTPQSKSLKGRSLTTMTELETLQ